MVCTLISVARASIALRVNFNLASFSSSIDISGYPVGCGIETDGQILFAPTAFEIGTIVHKCTHGIPASSQAFTIVAPQRVQVPHAEVSKAPSISAFLSASAIPFPNPSALSTGIQLPTVTNISS